MDPTLLQALISGGGAVLGSLLGWTGTYLIARKKLRHDAALYLYKKQVEASSAIVLKALELTVDRRNNSSAPVNPLLLSEFQDHVNQSLVYLPRSLFTAANQFWSSVVEHTEHGNFGRVSQALSTLINQCRKSLKIEPISAELAPFREGES